MDFIVELILELLFDGMMEASKSNKIPKFIRYPLVIIIVLFFILVIGFMFIASILAFKESLVAGLLLIIIDLFLLLKGITKFKKEYLIKRKIKVSNKFLKL